ncbi:MAG: phosphodiester glycosidase family protein [bacterium]|nr:phosphodiester glycosidase family protein [bacterium]
MTRVLAIFLLAVAAALPAAAAEVSCLRAGRVDSPPGWQSVAPGMDVRELRIQFAEDVFEQMSMVRITPGEFIVRLHWQPKEVFENEDAPPAIARRTGAAVVVNAGYFGTDGRPLGFFKTGGKVFNRRLLYRGRRTALHFGAVFHVEKGGARVGISDRDDFRPSRADEAFQAGPYLVRRGRPVTDLSSYREFQRPARRSILALDSRGRLVVIVSHTNGSGISWCEMQAILSRPEAEGGLGMKEAMNLDGGASSQLYIQGENYRRHLEGRFVPALIVISPRNPKKEKR